jgi:hypothetical protein
MEHRSTVIKTLMFGLATTLYFLKFIILTVLNCYSLGNQFCVLILYPATLPKGFIISKIFLDFMIFLVGF